ncbi:MAG: SRPBCC family protein [Proteobacteria bacterium]|nr:SRPBCC family protein [Pseudomonadota bacterium]
MLAKIALLALAAAALAAGAGQARAEVVDVSPIGFELKETAEIAAPAAKVWAALVQPGLWWNGEHSWSGDARNITLDPHAGGCWCETIPPAGGTRHMTVIYVVPGREMRLEGALGPYQFSGAASRLAWTLAEKEGRTTVTWTYDTGGYVKGGIDKHAAPVDGVLAEQLGRLKRLVEMGKPAP